MKTSRNKAGGSAGGGALSDGKKKPLRQCVVCRARKHKEELLRAVLTKDGAVSLDEGGKAQGRGAYVCRSGECTAKLIKQRGFNRSFKRDVGAEIYKEIGGPADGR